MAGKALRAHVHEKVVGTTSQDAPVPVVGIGASAGGLEAIEKLLSAISFPCGKAFVIIQHLNPNRAGALVELLQRIAPVAVEEAQHETMVRADCVYVIPPGRNIALKGSRLELSKFPQEKGMRLPIDFFFRSLAAEQKAASVGVVLSGMGSDGTDGLRSIVAAGGRAFAQLPDSAQFDGMPTSAISTGLVDAVGTPEDLALSILTPAQEGRRLFDQVKPEYTPAEEVAIAGILGSLFRQSGHDFRNYKASLVRRRIERRMEVTKIPTLAGYAKVVAREPGEAALLSQSFLIGVTAFLRDTEFWDHLAAVTIPALLRNAARQNVIRVWIPGCATGEEAYTLAMLLAEAQDKYPVSERQDIRLFATDLDSDAIDFAREGLFEHAACDAMPASRRQRWFVEEQGRFRVRSRIRELVVFAVHDVVADPPFTKLDLLSCRNLMIYLDSDSQRKLLHKFHHCLNPSGFLLLGTSEGVPLDDHSFVQTHPPQKIFQPVPVEGSTRVGSPLAVTRARATAKRAGLRHPRDADLNTASTRALIEHFSPPAVVVSDEGELLQILGRVGRYLEPGAGKASLNIYAMARTSIRTALNDAVRAVTTGRVRKASRLGATIKGSRSVSRVTVKRLTAPGPLQGYLMIAFDEAPMTSSAPGARAHSRGYTRTLSRLEQELEELRQENANSGHELTAANEELQAINEELQSTNDELMTSKEEAQSINLELQTMNVELHSKLSSLAGANNDLHNMLESSDVATIFLDKGLHVRRFTRPITRLFRLIPSDVGRALTDVQSDLLYRDLDADATQVMASLIAMEKEIAARSGRWYLTRIVPYRTVENIIDGVLITFADISAIKHHEKRLPSAEHN